MMMQGSHIRAMEYGGVYDAAEFDSLTGTSNDTSNGIIETFEGKLQKKKDKKKEKALRDAEELENENCNE